jgi:hypothetical protein
LHPALALRARREAQELVRRTLLDAANAIQREAGQQLTGNPSQPGVEAQPSHSRLNIDDPGADARGQAARYPIARALAEHVVAQIDPLTQAAWAARDDQARNTARQAVFAALGRFLVNPSSAPAAWRAASAAAAGREQAPPAPSCRG